MSARSKYPSTPFVIPWSPPWVILPHSVLNEIKSLPEDQISFKKHAYDRFLGRYTGLGQSKRPEAIQAIKLDLTRSITKVLIDLQDETGFALDTVLGSCDSWTPIRVHGAVLQLVARTSARAFVGLPLARDTEWLEASIKFTTDTLDCVTAFRRYPSFLWPLVSPWLPELRKLRDYRVFAAEKLRPQINDIVTLHRDGLQGIKNKDSNTADLEALKHNYNMIHWMVGHYHNIDEATAEDIGQLQMTSAFAAISPIGMAVSYAIFDLAAHPEWQEELREEIRNVIKEDGIQDGKLTKRAVPRLRKLDSFIKESQRISPPFLTALNRVVTAKHGLRLSTGHVLAKGTVIGFGNPFHPLSDCPHDTTYTSKGQAPLMSFDPWRYSRLRESEDESNGHQYITVDLDNIAWGYGRNVCPGRFFAGNTVKCILVEILRRYDIGVGPQGQGACTEFPRPKTVEKGWSYAPDPEGTIWIRNRSTSMM
ncbi:putative Ent-kaurene oxidase [Myriangium duriaei CBS 260.36]|uniref:Ent-kaurene oxidase n=1 Tax=Myriangium duriaei CBS 260.36 TaxID=1168546 RepID=A0A9P4IXT2_9PEZI|nr:putative Ent-kaurene oxidase [Myriangium duriaei CBS 260.36]